MSNKVKQAIWGLASLLAVSAVSHGAFLDFQAGQSLVPGQSLAGSYILTNGWNELNTSRVPNKANNGLPYGSHNDTSAWKETLPANLGAGTAVLFKTGGYGYIASESLHQGFPGTAILPGGTFTVTDTAIANLKTIIFQIQATDREGQVFAENGLPVLIWDGGQVEADFSALYAKEYHGESFGFDQYLESWAFQWNVYELGITEGSYITIQWTGVTNSGIFALQLDQSDGMAQAVPEPAHYASILAGWLVALLLLRRKIRQ